MNKLKNRVFLIGNLGHDPETRELQSGKKVSKFTLATNDIFKNSEGQKVTETTWHNVVAWNRLADFASKYLKKGGQVCIEGRISYRSYEDKAGVTKYITEIVADEVLLLNRMRSAGDKAEA
ncbi:MAG: single-stranded DNA-binding protein [Bacteroidales bacterium]